VRAEQTKNTYIKIIGFIIIAIIIIGIVIWRTRKKTEIKEIIQENPPVSESSSVERRTISGSPSEQEKIPKIDIQPIVKKEKEVSKKKEIEKKEKLEEREKSKDSTLRKLARQYADGEISKEEYERLKKILGDVM
jgi:uncharacterized membrane protein